jgi:DNA-binding transcriptional LysR family regulator
MLGTVSDVDLRLLKVFMTVVRYRGFAAAQDVLNVSQANISMQMKHLEVRLGFKLCHRGRSGFWLTDEGKAVVEACQVLFRSMDEFKSAVASASGRVAGRLHVSVIDNSIFNATFHLHQAIRDFKEHDGDAEVVLYVVAPNEVEQMVFDGSCDLGIGFFPSRRQGLDFVPLFASRMNLYCGRGHPLFDKAPDGVGLEEVLAAQHAARGYVPSAQIPEFERKFLVGASASSVEGLATFVLSGKYTAYLPDHYALHWAERGEIRAILPERIGYESLYELVTRKGTRSKLLNAFTRRLLATRPELKHGGFQIGTSI